jgi:hypothetical protein
MFLPSWTTGTIRTYALYGIRRVDRVLAETEREKGKKALLTLASERRAA